jgi:hypothetical protein
MSDRRGRPKAGAPGGRAELHTGSLARFLKQEALIRSGLNQAISNLLSAPDEDPDAWEDEVRYQIETACIRSVDNFLSYISEVLQLAIVKRSEILRSSETITLDEVLRFSKYKDLISYLVDRTINRLSYKSFSDIDKYISDKTNISLVQTDPERTLLMTSIELRNIYSHNRGEASDATMTRLERFDHPLTLRKGERVEADLFLIEELLANLTFIARRADGEFARKFRLPRRRVLADGRRGVA